MCRLGTDFAKLGSSVLFGVQPETGPGCPVITRLAMPTIPGSLSSKLLVQLVLPAGFLNRSR